MTDISIMLEGSCDCPGFEPEQEGDDYCIYCGHTWDRHWAQCQGDEDD